MKIFVSATTATSIPVSTTEDLLAKFRKPAGDWECDTCMIHNNANATKCLACETPKPSSKKTGLYILSLYKMCGGLAGKRAEKKQIKNFELSTCPRSLEQAEYHTF